MATKTCIECGNDFKLRFKVQGKETNLKHRKKCLDCQPLDHKRIQTVQINSLLKEQNKKQCGKCKLVKDITNFYKARKTATYYHSFCKDCKNLQNKKRRQLLIDTFKGSLSCSICGYNKCLEAIHFHHLNPNEKENSLAMLISSGGSVKRIQEEIKKCIAVCANCHAEIHAEKKQNEVE